MVVTKAIAVRKATMKDVDQMLEIINQYAQQGLMLPRTKLSVCEHLQSFVVAHDGESVVGVAGLHILWEDLAEIRSLAIAERAKGLGVGKQLVLHLVDQCRDLGINRALALTYQKEFFEKCGFHIVAKETLPQKVWKDCINCSKLPMCDEIAMICETAV
ncbi:MULTISPECIES: N-acetyltransferase [Brevibacillus]|jgi:amino-acid N-acetyltransferase|uniref:Acetyltransferase n=1 Tax=Brevibacillus borstelensis AK1 TaxID=1300222 RepID=M8E949_9BACL|nr:N-acetyltransferase [Brevibacillus borstelensis]EMT52000.1 acetyltransferase [Brevibacillus borstelensis AK1]KKX56404.1 acetyltransferase [Brevibacillus borstelensis cifa_chp40]MBE5394161.1 N-acetyltransferase [Brevibacillus borstelensis]MCC0565534.1 N-acetyltransferase [Brevibacillus borstelensis]MCM3468887.1 N-acetyltransferase [Brevibacillus borstelensis]